MTPQGVGEVVARLFTAAGRNYGETHLEVYADALQNVPDDVGREAGLALARHVSWDCPPSVGLVMGEVNAILRNRATLVPALDVATGPLASREVSLEWLAKIRADLAAMQRRSA